MEEGRAHTYAVRHRGESFKTPLGRQTFILGRARAVPPAGGTAKDSSARPNGAHGRKDLSKKNSRPFAGSQMRRASASFTHKLGVEPVEISAQHQNGTAVAPVRAMNFADTHWVSALEFV